MALAFGAAPSATLALDPQKAITQYVHRAWRAEDGLPQNSVRAIAQTTDGYLWLGTEEGLVRFDGATFTVFDTRTTDWLKDNFVTALLADRDGGLWIGTNTGGVSRWAKGRFVAHAAEQSRAGLTVSTLSQGRDGSLWIGTTEGLERLKGETRLLSSGPVWVAYEDSRGALWAGTRDGLHRFERGASSVYTTRDGLGSNRVTSIVEDREGRLWVGTYGGGVSRLEAGRFTTYGRKDGLRDVFVNALYEDRGGSLWVGTRNGGLHRFAGGHFTAFTSKDGLSDDNVAAIAEDKEGNLWIGTMGGGLNRLSDGKLTTYSAAEGLSSDQVIALLEDREGALWVGMDRGGLDRVKGGRPTTYGERQGLSGNVTSLWEDREGTLWVGTVANGLYQFKDGRFLPHGRREGLPDAEVRALAEDRDGRLWAGTGAGLCRFADGRFTCFTTKQGMSSDIVLSLEPDPAGGLWIGTLGGGLCRLEAGRVTCFTTKQGLSSDQVIALHRDAAGSLWIGTAGSGLNRFRHGRFTAYSTRQGLLTDTIFKILEDDHGNLWMSGNKGIFRVARSELDELAEGKRSSLTSVAYGTADGMKSVECQGGYQTTAWKGRDGRLYFATLKGVTIVDPARLAPNPLPPPVVVEGLLADGRPLPTVGRAELAAGTTRVEFHYTALSFVAPEKVAFRYRLEGFDPGWVEAGTRRRAYYTNIPPGAYRFRVMASNNDGVWNEAGASLDLSLRPRFHQTFGFYVLCALVVASAAWSLHHVRVRGLQARNALLMERNDLAQEIHDNVSQIMTGIALQLDAAQEALASGTDASRPYLERARELSQQSIEEVRRAVRGLRARVPGEPDLATAMLGILRPLVQGTPVRVGLEERGRKSPLPRHLEREILHIGQEAVTNAVRHGQARQIEIVLGYEADGIRLMVRDDGCGFEPEAVLRQGGLGLSGIWRRVSGQRGTFTIKTRPTGGTTVEAFLPQRRAR